MKISLHVDYAFRVLLFLSINDDKKVTIAEIAAFYDISHEHLRKIVHTLSKSGYIKTYLGRNGGMELLKETKNINLKELFLTFEQGEPLDCKSKNCILNPDCSLSSIFEQAYQVFLETLDQYTFTDLIKDQFMKDTLQINTIPILNNVR